MRVGLMAMVSWTLRMRIFVYEFTCAAGLPAHALAAALQAEGWAMLSALLEDFSRVPRIDTLTLLGERCGQEVQSGLCRRISAHDEEKVFRELAAEADFAVVIAPELDGILLARCRWVVESGGRLLGPSPAAVKLTGDKLELARHLRSQGVPTPESRLFADGEEVHEARFPLVCKPRDGAGSLATFLVKNAPELRACLDRAGAEGWHGEALVQPWVPGKPVSVAFLIGASCRVALLPAEQRLSLDGRLHYLGGRIPLSARLASRAVAVAERAVAAVPELRGLVGVDLILGSAQDGSNDAVIEINPRPTTSYVGLRALAETNLAEAWLQVALRDEVPPLVWRSGAVQFDPDGTVQYDC